MFHSRFGEVDLTLQADASKLIPELMSGRFDAGLTLALVGKAIPNTLSFRDLLRGYSGPVNPIRAAEGIIPQLVDAQSWKFASYTPPAYPPLALQARIQGQVELELTIDPATGNVTAVKAISGHPILIANAAAAARTWQFILRNPPRQPSASRSISPFTVPNTQATPICYSDSQLPPCAPGSC
jgi:TonB family protein